MTQQEIEAIVLAEFRYWSRAEVPVELGIIASGAAANIFAAIKGFPAPWHPGGGVCTMCGGDGKIMVANEDDPKHPLQAILCPKCVTKP